MHQLNCELTDTEMRPLESGQEVLETSAEVSDSSESERSKEKRERGEDQHLLSRTTLYLAMLHLASK